MTTSLIRKIAAALLLLTAWGQCGAVSINDPTLTFMIASYRKKASNALKAQEAAMLLMTTGHKWTKEEVESTYNLQKQYSEYLDSFRDILAYAAQIYGFYHEVGQLTENFGLLSHEIGESPTNALAVALTPKRNTLYRDLILTSADIVNDIRQICLSDIKMTEKERIEILLGIRPKLKTINRKISRLARAVRYTSLNDVWLELNNRARPPVDKRRVSDAAFRRWRQNGQATITPPSSGGNGGNNPGIGGIIVGPSFPGNPPLITPGVKPDINRPAVKDTTVIINPSIPLNNF